jgi:predicted acetyltransferase
MPELSRPHLRYRSSFLEAMAEFRDEGLTGEDSLLGDELARLGPLWETDEGFAAYVVQVLGESSVPSQPLFVCATTWWWTDGTDYLGRISIRHELNTQLREVGGHIGYVIRPSRRREGHATRMLAEGLAQARQLGIEHALITCDVDNIGSRRVIERNGGVLEDERGGKLRFWVPTPVGGQRASMDFAQELVQRVTGLEGDPAAVGAAVTVELCGHWEHDGPCRWPHHTETVVEGEDAVTTVRFDATPGEVDSVRATIVGILTSGSLVGPDGRRTSWGEPREGGVS